jgi:ectoine hydroxylase-related dioxygenase (phytanoyl-CoA dioxygenase family)
MVVTNQLWVDRPDALELIEAADVDPSYKQVARELNRDGLSVLRGWHEKSTCAKVIEDYQTWCGQNPETVARFLDGLGHEKRLCNFHHWSEAALSIGQNPRIMQLLDFLFGHEAGIYTSLTFKYGTQQPAHRDTPHFATWPPNYFVGVWTALQDVHPDSGPLFYHKNGHRFPVDPQVYWEQASEAKPGASKAEQCIHALDLYNGHIIQESVTLGEPVMPQMQAGDTIIWHPQTPHGGSPAKNPDLTRWSIVFHCAPVDIQVHQHDRFFMHRGGDAPPDRYGFAEKGGRRVAVAGEVSFM